MEQITTAPPLTFEQAMALLDKRHLDTLAKIKADRKIHEEQMQEFKDEMKRRDKKFEKEVKKLYRGFGDLGIAWAR